MDSRVAAMVADILYEMQRVTSNNNNNKQQPPTSSAFYSACTAETTSSNAENEKWQGKETATLASSLMAVTEAAAPENLAKSEDTQRSGLCNGPLSSGHEQQQQFSSAVVGFHFRFAPIYCLLHALVRIRL